jgi:hypothetical protein
VDLLRDGCTLDPAVVGPDWIATVSRCAGGLRRLVVHSTTVDKAPWVGPLTPGSDPHVLSTDDRVAVLAGTRCRSTPVAEDKNGKPVVSRPATCTTTGWPAPGTPAAVQDGRLPRRVDRQRATGVDLRNRTVLWTDAATGPPALTEDRQVLLAGPGGFTCGRRPPASRSPR